MSDNLGAAEIRQFVERAERLHQERKALAADLSDLFSEAKGRGFNVKALKAVIARRAQDPAARDEFETMVDLYERAIQGA